MRFSGKTVLVIGGNIMYAAAKAGVRAFGRNLAARGRARSATGVHVQRFPDDPACTGHFAPCPIRSTRRVNLRRHYVRTEKFKLERAAGKALFAFKEDSLPVALDPITLETRGEWAAGPIATVRLPVRLRSGLHGNWYSNEQLGI